MRRVLSVYLPMWPVDLVRRRWRRAGRARLDVERRDESGHEPTIVLHHTVARRQLVTACCGQARARGVRRGMTVAHARALVEEETLRLVPEEAEHAAASLRALAIWAQRFSPVVAADLPDGFRILRRQKAGQVRYHLAAAGNADREQR